MHASESKFEFLEFSVLQQHQQKSVLLFWILEWCKLTLGLSWRFSTFIHGVSQNVYIVCATRQRSETGMMKKMWKCGKVGVAFLPFPSHLSPSTIFHTTEERSISRNFLFTKISLLFNIWQSPRHTLFFSKVMMMKNSFSSSSKHSFFSIGYFLLHLFTQLSLSSTFFASFSSFFFVVFRSQLKFYYAGKRIVGGEKEKGVGGRRAIRRKGKIMERRVKEKEKKVWEKKAMAKWQIKLWASIDFTDVEWAQHWTMKSFSSSLLLSICDDITTQCCSAVVNFSSTSLLSRRCRRLQSRCDREARNHWKNREGENWMENYSIVFDTSIAITEL